MELSAYRKIFNIENRAIVLIGEGELAVVDWKNLDVIASDVQDIDIETEIFPSQMATETLVLFFRDVITKREYLGYSNSQKTFVTIDGNNHEVML